MCWRLASSVDVRTSGVVLKHCQARARTTASLSVRPTFFSAGAIVKSNDQLDDEVVYDEDKRVREV